VFSIKNIVLCLGMLLTVNIANAIFDDIGNVLIVHEHSYSERKHIKEQGLKYFGENPIYFKFIPKVTKDNIPLDYVGLMVNPDKTWVYNGSFLDGVLSEKFREFYGRSRMSLSNYIRVQDKSAKVMLGKYTFQKIRIRDDQLVIFDPITADPMIVSIDDERVLKDSSYISRRSANLQKTVFEPHHFIYKPTIELYKSIPPHNLNFGSSKGNNIGLHHPVICRPYSTYIRALRRFL